MRPAFRRRVIGVILVFLQGMLLVSSESRADDNRKLFLMPGFTMGSRSGLMPRAGFDLGMLNLKCSDGCEGYGLVTGMGRRSPFEYYIGAGYGGAYMLAVWMEASLNFVGGQYTGVRALGAAGISFIPILPYVAVGYDKRPDSMYIEAGITGKIPIPL